MERHQGPEKISAVVTALQRQFPGSVFKVTSPIQENYGKLFTLYVFIDSPSSRSEGNI